jgi:hypothetical protein
MTLVRISLVFILAITTQLTFSQKTSKYDSHEAFAPEFYPNRGDDTRLADGRPGPGYWQNRADYNINAKLDDTANSITGKVEINYTNNSPNSLSFLWLQLDQNLYDQTSKGMAAAPIGGGRWMTRDAFNGGYNISSVTVIKDGKSVQVKPMINDTRMRIDLPSSL